MPTNPSAFVDGPDAAERYRAQAGAHAQALYFVLEQAVGAPWFLGPRFSAIDLFVWVLSYWRPGRTWLKANTPRVLSIAERVDLLTALREVRARNFPKP
jgi:GST-like protein